MAINTLATATLFMTQLDKIAVQEATTGWMDANAGQVIYNGGSEVKIPKMSVQGMGDYDREAGYQRGSVTLEYETRKMTQDRGRLFQLDPMDINEANFIPTAGAVMGEFQRTQVVPEIDAYRISKLATETLTADKAGMIGESYVPGTASTSALRKLKEGIKAVRENYNGALICQATPDFIMELELELAGKITAVTLSSGSGGTGSGTDTSPLGGVNDMFQTTAIKSRFKDLAKLIKDSWKSGDFTELGAMVGNKLNEALERIPWGKIQNTCNKIAKSIATFLNGFIEATDWKLVGNTFSKGLNTAFGFVDTFAKNFHWNSLGKAKALADHVDDDDKLNNESLSSLGQRGGWIINESGLYSLILCSKLPSAKRFKKWITSEVLPLIHKHGLYATDQVIDNILNNPNFGIELLTRLKEERAARAEAERKNAILMHVNKTYTVTEIAKELGLRSATQLNRILAEKKIQYQVNGTWVMYSRYSDQGYEEIKQEVLDSGRVIYHRRITQMGREFILSLFQAAA